MTHPISQPLTIDEVRDLVGLGTRLTVVLKFSLGELIDLGLEELNQLVEERILPEHEDLSPLFEDITYRVLDAIPSPLLPNQFSAGEILIEVSGDVELYNEDED